jgi:hypothetical protein
MARRENPKIKWEHLPKWILKDPRVQSIREQAKKHEARIDRIEHSTLPYFRAKVAEMERALESEKRKADKQWNKWRRRRKELLREQQRDLGLPAEFNEYDIAKHHSDLGIEYTERNEAWENLLK